MLLGLFLIMPFLFESFHYRSMLLRSRSSSSVNTHKLEMPDHGTSKKKSKVSSLLSTEVVPFGLNIVLAEEHMAYGNFMEAEKLAQSAQAIAEHTMEPNNIYSAYAQGVYADALYHEGKYKESSEQYKEALKKYELCFRSRRGPEEVENVAAMQLVAHKLLGENKFPEAELACKKSLQMTADLVGPNNTDTAATMVNLATAYVLQGKIEHKAEPLLKKAIHILEENVKDCENSEEFLSTAVTLAGALLVQASVHVLKDEEDNAFKLYEELEAMHAKGWWAGSEIADVFVSMAMIKWRAGKFRTAESILNRGVTRLEELKHSGVDKVRTSLNYLLEGKQPPSKPSFKLAE